MSKIPTIDGIPVPPISLTTSSDAQNQPNPDKDKDHPRYETAGDAIQPAPSRLWLRMSAAWWRSLQYVGMSLHFIAPPRPPSPSFERTVKCTISKPKGEFNLQFYTPKGYKAAKKGDGRKFPAVVNFHGGGFTIGAGTDDARFARFVLETCGALFVSVEYRLSPEHPFPAAVEDGADALLYLAQHAAELHIDPFKLATSGFSAGGNLAITSTIRLSEHVKSLKAAGKQVPRHRVRAIATWYPITDYTLSRAERRATSVRPDQTLPDTLTSLFDASYLYPASLNLALPWLSPTKASDELLAEAIPDMVIFYTCEWDMLLREGEELAKRLGKPPISKDVRYKMVPGVPHAWDKSPDPTRPAAFSEELYQECCNHLKEAFERS